MSLKSLGADCPYIVGYKNVTRKRVGAWLIFGCAWGRVGRTHKGRAQGQSVKAERKGKASRQSARAKREGRGCVLTVFFVGGWLLIRLFFVYLYGVTS